MELRRAGTFGSTLRLHDDGGVLATLTYHPLREAGEIQRADGLTWPVARAPRFGPWQVTDAAGQVLAEVTKQDAFRERLIVSADGAELWRLERRPNLGRRLLVVLDAATGAEVGRIETQGSFRRVHRLDLPVAPDHVVGLVAWTVGLLTRRDDSAAAQS
jgi:hypothetical protein